MRAQLRAGLTKAMTARNAAAVSALRSALAAIENAGVVDAAQAPPPGGSAHLAGSVLGVRAGEVPRRVLTEHAVQATVRAEVRDRLTAAAGDDRLGHPQAAQRLRTEAEILRRHLPGTVADTVVQS